MKKILPFALALLIIMLAIPLIAIIGGEPSPSTIEPNEPTKLPDDVTVYTLLDHKTGDILSLTPIEYITGVVAAEMPIDFHIEALKAQAVAAHTYALRHIDAELKKPTPELKGAFLTTDYTKNQAYISDSELKTRWGKNYDLNHKKLTEAVSSVINKVITYDDKPIIAAFHSISGGTTESAKNVWGQDISYLTPVKSDGDELSPSYSTKTTLTADEVEFAFTQAYPDIKFDKDKSQWFSIITSSESKTITEIKVGSITCTGKDVREILKLRSANFSVEYSENSFTFTTNGYGHGVGMSQYGADFLARQGKSYEEILKHYYTGTIISEIKTE